MHLSSDRIFFRSVNSRGIPEGVGAGNAGKHCTVILGHKEIETQIVYVVKGKPSKVTLKYNGFGGPDLQPIKHY